jgi:hypothetical protein
MPSGGMAELADFLSMVEVKSAQKTALAKPFIR